MRVNQYYQPVVLGAVVVGAVAIDRIRRTRIWRVSSQ
jgi:ribose/xylose/arabinose/galactoside ABC-type transport system permease subunit